MGLLLLFRPRPADVTTHEAQAILATFFDQTVAATRTTFATTTLDTTFGMTAAATKMFFAEAALNTDFGMTAAATKMFFAECSINTDFGMAAQSVSTLFARAELNVTFGLSAAVEGAEEAPSLRLRVDRERLEREPWPGTPPATPPPLLDQIKPKPKWWRRK